MASSRARRELHSFPTRRSSDLRAATAARAEPWGTASPSRAGSGRAAACAAARSRRRGRRDEGRGRAAAQAAARRSEEHTSELQSRQYLVCRLLLEKKKNTQRKL